MREHAYQQRQSMFERRLQRRERVSESPERSVRAQRRV
jgi:hypothetical protein